MGMDLALVEQVQRDRFESSGRYYTDMMALMAAALLILGDGGIGVLQQFIVLTAIPVSLVLLPSLWAGPRAAMAMARDQKAAG